MVISVVLVAKLHLQPAPCSIGISCEASDLAINDQDLGVAVHISNAQVLRMGIPNEEPMLFVEPLSLLQKFFVATPHLTLIPQ